MKVRVTEKVHTPAKRKPRFLVWLAALFAAPLSGGASLLAIPLAEAGFKLEDQRASKELDRLAPTGRSHASNAIRAELEAGAVSVRYCYGAQTQGWGRVSKEIDVQIHPD